MPWVPVDEDETGRIVTHPKGTLRERLESEIGVVLSSDLQAHVQRGAVVVIDAELSLVDVAIAVAEDDVASVQSWIDSRRMKNPSQAQIDAWKNTPHGRFRSVIVQPYVLVQELST